MTNPARTLGRFAIGSLVAGCLLTGGMASALEAPGCGDILGPKGSYKLASDLSCQRVGGRRSPSWRVPRSTCGASRCTARPAAPRAS